MSIAVSAQRDKHAESFSWRNSNLQAVAVGTVLSLLSVQNWCDFTAPLVCKRRGIWRQVSWGHLPKHGKCFPNNSRELQPSPAELSLPALGESFLCCPDPSGDIQQVGRAQPWGLGGPWYKLQTFHFRVSPEHGHPPVFTVPNFCTNPRLAELEEHFGALETPLLRANLGGDCKQGVPQCVSADCVPSKACWGGVRREGARWRVGLGKLARAIKRTKKTQTKQQKKGLSILSKSCILTEINGNQALRG